MIGRSILNVIGIVALAGGWTFTGYAFLPREARAEANREIVWSTAFAFGAGITTVALTILAMCRAFTPGSTIAVAAIVTLLGMGEMIRLIRRKRFTTKISLPTDPGGRIALAALAGILFFTLLVTLAPPSSMDATVYHLRVPREFWRSGFWARMDSPHAYQPMYVEMLFGVGLALNSPALAAMIHWAFGGAAVVAAAGWGRQLGGRRIWAALAFGGTAMFVWETASCFIDVGEALFASLALYWATRTEQKGAVFLGGVFAGLAAGSKFTGVVAAMLAAGSGFAMVWPDWRKGTRRILAIGALALVVCLPWYLRNWVLTHNPIYPLANKVFGLAPVTLVLLNYGVGTNLRHLLLSPFELLLRSDAFDQGWSIGAVYLAFVPLAMVIGRCTRDSVIAFSTLAAWWLVWFFSSPQARLLVPFMPVAAGLSSVAIAALMASTRRVVRWTTLAIVGVSVAGAFGTVAFAIRNTVKVVLGLESPNEYLARTSWTYPAYEAANRLLPPGVKISVRGAGNLFYLDRPAWASGGIHRSADELRREGFTHELSVGPCPLAVDPDRSVVASGNYSLPASRLRGGVYATECYELLDLHASGHASP